MRFEYKAVPAPVRGTKAKGIKTTEDRFALSMTNALNEHADDGWEFVRVETLPCESRKGLTGTQITDQTMMVFRRIKPQTEASEPSLPPLTLETPPPAAQPTRVDPPISRSPEVSDPTA